MVNQYKPDRKRWINFVKVIAIFSVALIHTASPWFNRYRKESTFVWQIANIYDSVIRPSVPLFFMDTGYFLLNKPHLLCEKDVIKFPAIANFIKKDVKRVDRISYKTPSANYPVTGPQFATDVAELLL